MGFINVKKCTKEPQELLKLIVLMCCVLFTIYQLSECISKLLHPPVSTYYKFNLNESMKYPSLTFCRKPAYKKDLFPKYGLKKYVEPYTTRAFINFDFKNYNLDDFLEETTYSFSEMLGSYGFSGNGLEKTVQVKESFHLHYGRCVTLTPQGESSTFSIGGGYFLYFLHNEMNKNRDEFGIGNSGYRVYLHDDNEILSSQLDQENNFLEYLYIESSEDMRVKLKVQEVNQISTTDEPCVSELNYSQSKCIEECFHHQLAVTVGCSVAWLRIPQNISFPRCSNYGQLNYLLSGLLIPLNRTRYLQNCNCPISCNLSIYTSYIINNRDVEKSLQPNCLMMIYYGSNLVEVMSKTITYDWSLFMSDIGGSLGFLLGLSVIGVIAALEQIFKIIIVRFFKNKKAIDTEVERKPEQEIEDQKVSNKDVKIDEYQNENNDYKHLMDYLSECDYFQKNKVTKEREINKY